jgi:hypothetical protein
VNMPDSVIVVPPRTDKDFTTCGHGVTSSEAEGTCFLVKPDPGS